MKKTFKTPKGTELPILDLRGKDYLQVAHRLVWFREEHPAWTIDTRFIELSPTHAVARAEIKDEHGRIISAAHKREDKQGFGDFHEKAETGSIGRALAHSGYGTQFAPELDESERIVDSPVNRPKRGHDAAERPFTPTRRPTNEGMGITKNQEDELRAVILKANWTTDDVLKYLQKIGKEKLADLNYPQWQHFMDLLKVTQKGRVLST